MIRRAEVLAAGLCVAAVIWFRTVTIAAGSALVALMLLAGLAHAWSPEAAAGAPVRYGQQGPVVEQRSTCHALKVTLLADAAGGGDSFRVVSDGDLVWPEDVEADDDEAVRDAGWVAHGTPATVKLKRGVSAQVSFWSAEQGWSDGELAGVQWPWLVNWSDPLNCDPKPTVTFRDECDGSVEVTIRNTTRHDRLVRISGGGLHPEPIWVSSGTEAHTVRWPAEHAGTVTVELRWGSVWKTLGEHRWASGYGYTCPTPSPTPSGTPAPTPTPSPSPVSDQTPSPRPGGDGGQTLPDTSSGLRAVAWLAGTGGLLSLVGVVSLVLARRRRART